MSEVADVGSLKRVVGGVADARYLFHDAERVLRIGPKQLSFRNRSIVHHGTGEQPGKGVRDLSIEYIQTQGIVANNVLIGNLIQLQCGRGVGRSNDKVRALGSGIGEGGRGFAIERTLESQVPLLHIAIRLLGKTRPKALAKR